MKKFNHTSPATQAFEDQIFCKHNGFILEVCMRPESLATAFSLRYRAYLKVGAISPNEEQMLYDAYDFAPNSRIHLVWYQGKAVATVRGCIWSQTYSWEKTEALSYFEKDIREKLDISQPMLESNRYAVDPDFQGRQSLYAQILMFRIHALNSTYHGCTHILTSVRPNHIPFYKRFLGMDTVSQEALFIPWAKSGSNSEVFLLAAKREDSLEVALKRGLPKVTSTDINLYAHCAKLGYYSNLQQAA